MQGSGQLGLIITDQPIIAASIGLAIGAVLAAALPSSDVENQLMGSPATKSKSKLPTWRVSKPIKSRRLQAPLRMTSQRKLPPRA